jgi:hypothetical protein
VETFQVKNADRAYSTSQSSFKRYPELRDRFNAVVINFFKESMVPTNKLVTDMVACVGSDRMSPSKGD